MSQESVDRIIRALSTSLSVIFYWFGIQKFFPGASPAEDIAGLTIQVLTAHLLPPEVGLFLLACWEIVLGVGLLLFPRSRWALWPAFLHLCFTFAPFIIFPGLTFGVVLGSLTLLGQYIVKNLVLLAGLYTLVELERASRAAVAPAESAKLVAPVWDPDGGTWVNAVAPLQLSQPDRYDEQQRFEEFWGTPQSGREPPWERPSGQVRQPAWEAADEVRWDTAQGWDDADQGWDADDGYPVDELAWEEGASDVFADELPVPHRDLHRLARGGADHYR
jgi:uncharacterized membrane protein YphA (DoxX/SURF4 family)